MMHTNKIVWTEGMFLRPHHFQQAEKYLEGYTEAWGRAQHGNHWGFVEHELDAEALRRGSIVLAAASGIFPDGTYFSFRGAAQAPAPLEVEAHRNAVKVVLALPAFLPGREQVAFEEGADSLARFGVREKEVDDFNAVAVGRAGVQVARMRLRLMPENELTADWTAIGVASVVERRQDGSLLLDSHYIPPVLDCHVNDRLEGFVSDLLGLLQQRSQMLAQHLGEAGRSGVSEVTEFLMLQLLNRYHGFTHHVGQQARVHPERLFSEWLKLACDLATFSTRRTISAQLLPRYDHDDLAGSFGPLMMLLRQHLSIVIQENAIQLDLVQKSHGLYVSSIADPRMLQDFGFVLAVNADVPTEMLRGQFPAKMKIAPVHRIKDLVQLQLPGILLNGMPVPPREIPYHAGYTYFELEKAGDLWHQMERSGAFALHVAGEFPALNMEFWAIRTA